MQSEQRQHCLAAFGVVQYLPRDSWQLAATVATPAAKASRVAAPPAAAALLAELADPVAPAAAEVVAALTPAYSVQASTAPNASLQAAATPLQLALWQTDDQWLFIADALPAHREQQLLANMAGALDVPRLNAPELIEWPLAGDAHASDDPLGHEFLAVLFDARLQNRPVKRVVLLSDTANGGLVARLGERAANAMAGLAQISLPSLGAMLADSSLKRSSWQALQPYRTPADGG